MSFLSRIFSSSPVVVTPVVVRQPVEPSCHERIANIALPILVVLASFLFLPLGSAIVLVGVVTLIASGFCCGLNNDGRSSGLWTVVGNAFSSWPREEVDPRITSRRYVPGNIYTQPTIPMTAQYVHRQNLAPSNLREREAVNQQSSSRTRSVYSAHPTRAIPIASNEASTIRRQNNEREEVHS